MKDSDYRWAEFASWIIKNKFFFNENIRTASRLGNFLVTLKKINIV